jgi:hypothetical protein
VPTRRRAPVGVPRLEGRRRCACRPRRGRRAAGRADPGGARRRPDPPGLRGAAGDRRAQRRRRPRRPGEPQAGGPGDGRARHRRDPAAPPGPHHDRRAGRRAGARPAGARLHRAGCERQVRRRHHASALRRRQQPVPGHGDRLLLPPAGGLVDRRPHAHRAGRRRPDRSRCHPRRPGRGDLPQRPRRPGRIQPVVATPRSWRC